MDHTQRISFFSPLTINIFGLLLNLGQLLDIGLVILIVFLVIKRWLVKTTQLNRIALLSDNRFVPIILRILFTITLTSSESITIH